MSGTDVAIPDAPTTAEELSQGTLTGAALQLRPPVIGLPSTQEWVMLSGIANTLANSDMVPKGLRGKPQDTLAVILKGRDLGLTPPQSVWGIHMIEGMPSLAVHTMIALIRKAGHDFDYESSDATQATVVARRYLGRHPVTGDREYGEATRITWTLEQAISAGLVKRKGDGTLDARSSNGKQLPWMLYPEALLRARAGSAMARMLFSDVLLGAWYTPEELGANVNEQGQVTALPSPGAASRAFNNLVDPSKPQEAREPDQVQSARPSAAEAAAGAALAPEFQAAPVVVDVEPEPQPRSREDLLAELDEHARVLAGGSVARYAVRGVAQYKANPVAWTEEQLEQFLAPRRAAYAAHIEAHPEDAPQRCLHGRTQFEGCVDCLADETADDTTDTPDAEGDEAAADAESESGETGQDDVVVEELPEIPGLDVT